MSNNVSIIGLLLALTILCPQSAAFAADNGTTGAVKSVVTNPQELIRLSLDGLISAYSGKNIRQFMDLVSESYTGDASVLESSIRRDFSDFTNLSMRYTFNNVTSDGKGNVSVALTSVRDHTVIKTGKQATIKKQATLIFKLENGAYRLYSQKSPRLFGRDFQ